jgi:hypothetical protein
MMIHGAIAIPDTRSQGSDMVRIYVSCGLALSRVHDPSMMCFWMIEIKSLMFGGLQEFQRSWRLRK